MANNLRDIQLSVQPVQQGGNFGNVLAETPQGWVPQLQAGPPAAHLMMAPQQMQQLQLMQQVGYGGGGQLPLNNPMGQMMMGQGLSPAFNNLGIPGLQGGGMQSGNPQLGMDTTGYTFMAPQPLQGSFGTGQQGGFQGGNSGAEGLPSSWNPYWDY